MNVSLNPQFEKLVKQKVQSGEYASESEVIQEALRLLEQRDKKLIELRAEIQIGLDQLERGEYTTYDEDGLKDLAKTIKSRGRERLESERKQTSNGGA